jgi:hypothetical protein
MHFPDTLKTIASLNPAARVIVVLRHPVERMLSLHRYAVQHGLESRPAEDALRDDLVQRADRWRLQTYSGGSRYAEAIDHLHEVFSDDRVLFLKYPDVCAPAALRAAEQFLGLEPTALTPVHANESRARRSAAVARTANSHVARAVGRRVVPARWRETMRGFIESLNATRVAACRDPISAELRAELVRRHALDVLAAERVLDTRLRAWLS